MGVRFDKPCLNIEDLAVEIDKVMKRGGANAGKNDFRALCSDELGLA